MADLDKLLGQYHGFEPQRPGSPEPTEVELLEKLFAIPAQRRPAALSWDERRKLEQRTDGGQDA
jgi:hypothetical protein